MHTTINKWRTIGVGETNPNAMFSLNVLGVVTIGAHTSATPNSQNQKQKHVKTNHILVVPLQRNVPYVVNE